MRAGKVGRLLLRRVAAIIFLVLSIISPAGVPRTAAASPTNSSVTSSSVNLIANGGFESGSLAGWSQNGTSTITSAPVHSGSYAARSTGGYLSQGFPVTPGMTYKVTAWVYLLSVTGGSWGGVQVWTNDPLPSGWVQDGGTGYLQGLVQPNTWTEIAFSFTPTQTTNVVNVGNFGDRTVDAVFDDVQVFIAPAVDTPPTISISANPTSVSSRSTSVSFTSVGNDVDGAIAYYFWDFGDGGKSNLPNPSYTYSGNGVYTVTLTVYDDSGGSASAQTLVTVNDPTYPTLQVTAPGTSSVTSSSPTVTFTGTSRGGSGSSISAVSWSTDRGQTGVATGTDTWSFTIDLGGQGGRNRVTIDATDANGNIARQDVIVTYMPGTTVSVASGAAGVSQNAQTVSEYDKFEATFSLQNLVASNPYLPYDTAVPAGMVPGIGVSVTGFFTSPTKRVYAQPGFFYQPYARNTATRQLIATGSPVWMIRFAPMELGAWTYEISVTDASGTSVLTDARLAFQVVPPTNPRNHGFLRVSPTDSRYFAFSDGTPFIGVGPGASISDSFGTDQSVAQVGAGSANLSRIWMSGSNVSGSSWAPWSGGIPYDGNVPGSSLTSSQAYGDGQFSLNLSATGNQCAFYGFAGTKASVMPNTNYRILIRLKTVGLQGSGGFTFRPLGSNWPNSCGSYAAQPLVVPYQNGTEDWHTVTATWNSGSATLLGIALLTLENVTGGQVYIDEVSIRQDLGGGQYGPEVLPRSNFNTQNYFSQEPSWNWDYGLDQFAQNGLYVKAVIEEKQDYVYNHLSPYGFGYAPGGLMTGARGATLLYQQYFWRYLTARYGYSRAVHSWEYANEQAPGDLYMAEQLGKYMKQTDPELHLVTTSDWAGITYGNNQYEWQDPSYPDVSYADAHAYVNSGTYNQATTSWLGTTDPFTGGSTVLDSAQYTSAHSIDQYSKNAAGNKPMVIGESGIINGTTVAGLNDADTKGIWLHQFLWPQLNVGGAYFIYWYDATIRSNNLYPLFAKYREFMEGSPTDQVNTRVPLDNGKYVDIQLSLPSGIYGWGQKDTLNGGAHFWMYDSAYTWTNPSGGTSLASKTVSFSGLPANIYTVQWWDTWLGTYTTQTINFAGGTMVLTVPATFTGKDVAVKVFPQIGYSSLPPLPTPTPAGYTFSQALLLIK